MSFKETGKIDRAAAMKMSGDITIPDCMDEIGDSEVVFMCVDNAFFEYYCETVGVLSAS